MFTLCVVKKILVCCGEVCEFVLWVCGAESLNLECFGRLHERPELCLLDIDLAPVHVLKQQLHVGGVHVHEMQGLCIQQGSGHCYAK